MYILGLLLTGIAVLLGVEANNLIVERTDKKTAGRLAGIVTFLVCMAALRQFGLV